MPLHANITTLFSIPEHIAKMLVMQADGQFAPRLEGQDAQRALRQYCLYNRAEADRVQASCPDDAEFMRDLLLDYVETIERKCLGNPDFVLIYTPSV